MTFEEEAGTSNRLHPLQRPKFGELLAYARRSIGAVERPPPTGQ